MSRDSRAVRLACDAVSAEWLTAYATLGAAIGTVAAVGVALWQVWRERSARRRLEEEDRRRARRAQAEQVSAWLLPQDNETRQPIALLNASVEPVYQAVVYLVFIQGAAPRTGLEMERNTESSFRSLLSVVPPGRGFTSVGGGWGAMTVRPGVECAFTDRAGVHWIRSADGTLVEIDESPVDYYGVIAPRDWRVPEMGR